MANNITRNLALYTKVEEVLRRAMEENKPQVMADIMKNSDIMQLNSSLSQVQNVVSQLVKKKLVNKVVMPRDHHPRNTPGYVWIQGAEWPENKHPRKHSKVKVITPPPQEPTEVEITVQGITVVIGKNPSTGRLKITIE
jgi:hypothetical protein